MENLTKQVKAKNQNQNLIEAFVNLKNNKCNKCNDNKNDENKQINGKDEQILIKIGIERNKKDIEMIDEKIKHLEEKEIKLKQLFKTCRYYNRGYCNRKPMQISSP